MAVDEVFVLEDGDGDPQFIHAKHRVRFVREEWFPSVVMDRPAQLLVVLSGSYEGQYVSLTSRVVQSIDAQLADGGFASVVARPIRNPTASFNESTDLEVGGMTVIHRFRDRRFDQ